MPVANPRRSLDAARLAQLQALPSTAAVAKANSRPAERTHTLVHRLRLGLRVIGFAVSRMARRSRFCRLLSMPAIAAVACRSTLLLLHLGISPAAARAAFFWRSRK